MLCVIMKVNKPTNLGFRFHAVLNFGIFFFCSQSHISKYDKRKRISPEYFPCDVDTQNIQVLHDPQKHTA